MRDAESQEKGDFSENEDPVDPENVTEDAETRNECAIHHVRKSPYDQSHITPITEGDRMSMLKPGMNVPFTMLRNPHMARVISHLQLRVIKNLQEKRDLGILRKKGKTP